MSVVDAVTCLPSISTCLLFFSDNSNTVNIFHSLCSLPPYNDLLKFTMSLLIKHNISLRVVYIPGVDNVVADSLSQFENTKAIDASPGLIISRDCHRSQVRVVTGTGVGMKLQPPGKPAPMTGV